MVLKRLEAFRITKDGDILINANTNGISTDLELIIDDAYASFSLSGSAKSLRCLLQGLLDLLYTKTDLSCTETL